MAEKQYKFIKEGALIKIEIGRTFYERLQYLLLYLMENGEEDVSEATEAGAEKKALKMTQTLKTIERLRDGGGGKTAFEEHLITLTGLLYQLELDADSQGWLEEKPLPNPQ